MSQAQNRAKIIVILEWLGFVVAEVILFGICIYIWINFDSSSAVNAIVQKDAEAQHDDVVFEVKFIMTIFGVLGLIVGIFQGALTTVLHKGVYQRREGFLQFWLILQYIFFILAIIVTIVNMIRAIHGDLAWHFFCIYHIIPLIYRGTSIRLVKNFRDEVCCRAIVHSSA